MNFVIGADHPALPGHFPGRPVVPGVVVIARIVEALTKAQPDLRCVGVRHVKFKRAVPPGVEMELEFGAVREDAVQARVLGDQKLVYVEARLTIKRIT